MKPSLAQLLVALVAVVLVPVAPAHAGDCGVAATLEAAQAACPSSSKDVEEEKEKRPTAKWSAIRICKNDKVDTDGRCLNPEICVTASGLSGTLHTITRDEVYVTTACLTDEEAGEVAQPPMSALVLTEFKKLKWPASRVSVQPTGGETLVNLETWFFTDNTEPSSVTVTLLSKKVTIVAEPVSYTWSFGDGEALTSSSAGARHPEGDITHVYTSTETVEASVATTYQGRYKVGDGSWRNIDEPLTVPGPEATLEVLEAKPQLLIR